MEMHYKDKSLSTAERAADLVNRMSLREKIEQLCCYMLTDPNNEHIDVNVGAIAVINAGKNPEQIAHVLDKIQKTAIQNSRFGIPVLFHSEALVGGTHPSCTVFPLPIGQAATFNEKNVKDMAEIIRKELRSLGIRHALSPVLDIARDFRYGRTAETFGGDAVLTSLLGCAYVRGLQGDDLKDGIAATAKHFLGCAQPEAGVNQTRAVVDSRELEETIAKPFEAVIRKAGLKTVMNSYGEVNGEPFCASDYYLKDFLRDRLGFTGLTVSDYHSIDRLLSPYRMAETETDVAAMALNGGMDIEFPSKVFYRELEHAKQEGKVDETIINSAVYRMLYLKFELGLFEHPYSSLKKDSFCNEKKEKTVSEITAQTITLVKNQGILPLKNQEIKIGVIGQPADSLRHMYGAYTAPATQEMLMDLAADSNAVGMAGVKLDGVKEQGKKPCLEYINEMIKRQYPHAQTIVEALKQQGRNVSYAKGFPVGGGEKVCSKDIEEAKRLAERSDVIIVCVGGRNGVGKECTSGEGIDTVRIELLREQEDIVKELFRINPNMIIVHMDARPLVSHFIYEHAKGIIEAWLPCTYGGKAVADVILGNYNPCGHLPVDIPKSTGQQPYFYSQRNGSSIQSIRESTGDFIVNKNGYVDEKREPERPFGYGLSYTSFEYKNMTLHVGENNNYIITVTVKNIGERDGRDVVQLYGIDEYASIARPVKELLGCSNIFLNAGQTAVIEFRGNLNQFAFCDKKGSFKIEKGVFRFEIAQDSQSPVLSEKYELRSHVIVDRSEQVFFADAKILVNK